MPDDLSRAVIDALRRIAPEIDPAAIEPRVALREQFDLDSMDFLNFVIGLHESLGVEIPEADYRQLSTLDGATRYLAARLEAAKATPPAGRTPA